ncbi:MAG: bifunctional folylpolyglutamate synthase/dihydrofolate synthase [Prevotella sp.]|nr:bifunctional folylpolyglutamate synthase/dihydrofolate synthase [Prevotella sp.]
MNYDETIAYLYQATPVFEHQGASAYKPGLQTTEALDAHYGHPHRHYPTIHVAGTNGKGSCSHSLASILQEAGLRVGLYTSPHLVDFRERIRVNGECIPEQRVIDFVEDFISWNQDSASEASSSAPRHAKLFPSFFELTTALAFKYFEEAQVDVAVIEVGLGGRLDCTNIITPILSVITNISFDHTQFLGHTLEQIAGEKAGIIKHGVPVVIGETTPETRPVFEQKARKMQAPIYFAEEFSAPDPLPDFELRGSYQQRNLHTILCAISLLSRKTIETIDTIEAINAIATIDENAIARGLARVSENTGLMGRWQTLQERPRVVCDTGHNVAGWQYLAPQIEAQPCRQLRIVFGMVDDKDLDAVLQLMPRNATYYFTQADNHRAIPAKTVAQKAAEHQLSGQAYTVVADAYRQALADAHPDDFIFIGGSSYVVADLLTFLCKS